MAVVNFVDGIRVGTKFQVEGDAAVSGITRASLDEESLSPHTVPLTSFRVWDAIATLLPSAGANDDLGLLGNTFATGTPTLETGDLKTAGATTRYGRVLVQMPMNYNLTDIVLRFHAGMKTTIADTSATIDCSAYLSDEEAGITGSDLVSTAAQSINSLTLGDYDFTVSNSSVVAGSLLDVRVAVTVTDGASGTAVIGQIGAVKLLCDTKG